MRNIGYMIVGVWVCFVAEYFLAQSVPVWLRPNFLLLLMVFFNLYRGIRHSLLVGFLAGLVKDCFAPGLFGLNIFSFMVCAYLVTFLKMYIYETGSGPSRMLLVLLITFLYVLVEMFSRMMFIPVDVWGVVSRVMLPQIFATTIVSVYVLKIFRQCALKLFA